MREENCVKTNACECAETCANNGMCCSVCRRNAKLIDHYHKVKTYKDDFFEKFPNAPRTDFGFPRVLLGEVYLVCKSKRTEFCRSTLVFDLWLKPLGYWEGK